MRMILASLGAVALPGCAAAERITLHPGDGGALAVLGPGGAETVIDQPLTQASLGTGKIRTRSLEAANLGHLALFADLPPEARLFRITFPQGDARIRLDQRAVIDEIRSELASRPGAQIEVAGFTDSIDTEEFNERLSRRRAEAVADELRGAGFEIADEDIVGRGEYDAQARLGDDTASEEYRRVFVIVR